MGENLWNAAAAAGPYVLCLLLTGLAIWGLGWVLREYAEFETEESTHGDVVHLPEGFWPTRELKTRGRGAAEQGGRAGTHNVTSLTDDREAL